MSKKSTSAAAALPVVDDSVTVVPDLSTPAPKFEAKSLVIPLDIIDESPTNPRKTFGDMSELIASVRKSGVLQPVLVRPKKDRYELVYGHRRFKAAQGAGLAEIPANVRELTDLEVLEIQLVENAQRQDIHPLEEADGYRRLHDDHKLSVPDIAKKVGKSKAAVYASMKLCSLVSKTAREAFLRNDLAASTALLIARIPDEKVQEEAAKDIVENRDGHFDNAGPMSVREAAEHIAQNFMVDLKAATFDLAAVDLVEGATSCVDCPKRTGNLPPGAYGDSNPNVCIDPKCFDAKLDAGWAAVTTEAKAKGIKVLSAKDSKEVFPHEHNQVRGGVYVDINEQMYDDLKRRSPKKILGEALDAHLVLARDYHARTRELVNTEILKGLLKKHGWKSQYASSQPAAKKAPAKKRDPAVIAKEKLKKELPKILAPRLVDAIVAKLEAKPELDAKLIRWIAATTAVVQVLDPTLKKYNLKIPNTFNDEKAAEELAKIDARKLRGFLFEALLGDALEQLDWRPEMPSELLLAAKMFGVDAKRIEAEVTAELQPKPAVKPGDVKNVFEQATASAHKTLAKVKAQGKKKPSKPAAKKKAPKK